MCGVASASEPSPSHPSLLLFSSLLFRGGTDWGTSTGLAWCWCSSSYQSIRLRKPKGSRRRERETSHSAPDTAAAAHVGGAAGAEQGDQATVKRARMVHSARVQWALLSRSRKSSEGRKGPCNGSDLHAASTEWRVDVAGVDHANEELRGPGFVPLTFSAMEGNSTVCLPELSSPQRHKLYEQIQRLSFPVSLFFIYITLKTV